jgi:lysosomal acid phosphatase
VKTSPEMRNYNEEHADLYRYISEQSGNSIHDAESLASLYNILFIEDLYNLTLPNWTKSVYPEKMKSVSSYSFTIPAKTELLQRLKIGKSFWDLRKDCQCSATFFTHSAPKFVKTTLWHN